MASRFRSSPSQMTRRSRSPECVLLLRHVYHRFGRKGNEVEEKWYCSDRNVEYRNTDNKDEELIENSKNTKQQYSPSKKRERQEKARENMKIIF